MNGRAAHSGAEPEKGCNAVAEVAHQVSLMSDLGDKEKETSVNFTLLQGGERSNIISEKARAQADVRVLDPTGFDRLDRDIDRLAHQKLLLCAEVTARLERGRPPFPSNKNTDRLVARARALYRDIRLELGVEGSGGDTDGNYTAAAGTITLDALGPVGGGAHTVNEFIDIDRIGPPQISFPCCASARSSS